MEAGSIEKSGVVWVASCGFTEAGEPQDYQIEEIDLLDKPAKTVKLLKEKLGDGVFGSYEAAEQWIAAKISRNRACCQAEKSEGNSCCCSQVQGCDNRGPVLKK